jgi:hypothetical protein
VAASLYSQHICNLGLVRYAYGEPDVLREAKVLLIAVWKGTSGRYFS